MQDGKEKKERKGDKVGDGVGDLRMSRRGESKSLRRKRLGKEEDENKENENEEDMKHEVGE